MLATIDRFRQSNGEVPFQERQRVHGQTTSLMLQPSRICERLFDISSPEVPFCGPAHTRGRSDSRPGQPRPDWCPDRSRSNVAPSLSSGSGHAPHHGRPARKTSRRLNRNRRRPILHRTRSKRVQPHRRLGESRPGAFTHARDESLARPAVSLPEPKRVIPLARGAQDVARPGAITGTAGPLDRRSLDGAR